MSEYSEEFEAFCEKEGYEGEVFKANLWKVWQAAYTVGGLSDESPEVEIPEGEWLGDSWCGGWAILKENLVDSLEEQGFKVKK